MAATFITEIGHHLGLMGSTEKRMDTAPDGSLWLLVSGPTAAKLFRSTDGGSTWAYSKASDLSWVSDGTSHPTYPSFYIDADGYAHVSWSVWNRSPQQIGYARGKPRVGGGWSWTVLRFTSTSRQHLDTDVVAFRSGTGWVAWLSHASPRNKLARINISGTGALSLAAAVTGPPDVGTTEYHVGAVEFDHTGNGKTPRAEPHVFLVSGPQGVTGPLRAWRAVFAAGSWTWEAPVELDATVIMPDTVMATVWDGERLCSVYEFQATPGLRFVQWAPGTAPARLDPPALPAAMTGAMHGVSISHDPVTDDLYVVAYATGTGTGGDPSVFSTRLSRAAGTWSAWAKVAHRAHTTDRDGKVQLVRHAPADTIDMAFSDKGEASADYTGIWRIFHQQLAQLARKPPPPALSVPSNGARVDLQGGATFRWQYRGTGLADAQQGWAFRRTLGTTMEFWNAGSQAWQATEVINSGALTYATFPVNAWTNGQSYTWTVRTRSSSSQDSDYAAERSVVATAAPVVDVLSPRGLVFTSSTPTVRWSYSSADAQRTYDVRVFVEAAGLDPDVSTPVWSADGVASSTGRSVRVETPLADGQTYRAYVRATSTAGLTSAWDSVLFTLTLTPPTGPEVRVMQAWSYPDEVPYAQLRLVARTNHLGDEQARARAGWEAEANTTLADQPDDLAALIEEGLTMTATAAGNVGARTVLGSPPLAPVGEAQPAGPLSFPVFPGETYTAVAHFRTQTDPRAVRVSLRWYDTDEGADGNAPEAAMRETVGDQVNANGTSYTRATVTVTAPVGARRVTVVPQALGLAAGEVVYLSRVSLHPGNDTRWQPGGFVVTQTMRVERSVNGGLTWAPVAERVGVDHYQRAVVADRLMPLGTPVQYRAYTDVRGSEDERLSSGSSPVAREHIDADVWVLRDPSDPRGEVNALVVDHKRGDTDAATVSRPAGREYAIVDTEGAQSAEGTLTIYVPAHLREQTVELLRRGVPILCQSPIGALHLVHFLQRDYEPGVTGDRTIPAQYVEVG